MRRRESLVWGLVGALAFLVLVQGYELVAAVRLGFAVKGAVAVVVGGVTVVLAPVIGDWLPPNGRV